MTLGTGAVERVTVHALAYGRVLCGSVHGLPCGWGPGQRWASAFETSSVAHVTCAVCREAMEIMKGQKRSW